METFVFLTGAAVVLAGALGVILMPNTTRAALSLVATLFGVAVLFIAQEAHFLAVIQVIVYAGAIVVLFLFVLMLLGVDRGDDVTTEPIAGQRVLALAGGAGFFALLVVTLLGGSEVATGQRGADFLGLDRTPDVVQLGRELFTRNVFAFEMTAVLLTIAVVGAVAMVRRSDAPGSDRERSGEAR